MFTKIEPLAPYIVVRRIAGEEKTAGGLIIVPADNKESLFGEVMAVYKGCASVKPGDTICYKRYAGDPVSRRETGFDGLILMETDLVAIVA